MYSLPLHKMVPHFLFLYEVVLILPCYSRKDKCSYSDFCWKKSESVGPIVTGLSCLVKGSSGWKPRPVPGSAWPGAEPGWPAVRCRKRRWSWPHQ